MQSLAMRLRTEGKLIGFVPTSGFLHEGHCGLIRMAREEADIVVVSSFVNSRQFGPSEDYRRYPRDRDRDINTCREQNVDIVFIPREEEIYPSHYSTTVQEDKLSAGMCGISRPHYFRGVATMAVKLFNIVRPDIVVLGMKDPQHAAVIKRLVENLHFPIDIRLAPIVREPDGLAISARNEYLNDFQRKDAVMLYKALCKGKELIDGGITNIDRVLAEIIHHLSIPRRLRVIYVNAVDFESMEPTREIIKDRTLIAAAVWCDEVRLIDNFLV
jgi:pantoate--beta-alanine ligase